MTIDEATALGLFDLPDGPGLIRIPISIPYLHEGNDLDASAAAA